MILTRLYGPMTPMNRRNLVSVLYSKILKDMLRYRTPDVDVVYGKLVNVALCFLCELQGRIQDVRKRGSMRVAVKDRQQ